MAFISKAVIAMAILFVSLFSGISTKPVDRAECPQLCPAIYSPVCGSDGVSYPNICTLDSKNCADKSDITISFRGPCGEEPRPNSNHNDKSPPVVILGNQSQPNIQIPEVDIAAISQKGSSRPNPPYHGNVPTIQITDGFYVPPPLTVIRN
ncbi:unnamed protein product [Notodromas monacha]|uniref:Kazal-like domain-containing protein n=1 Tax=Notodromas monacha TaxID=399045 RepID=A0A7R9BEV7_9CRUS|nr:unnamed protein product [Notodromas monacha]CAG0914080.1 unnamed protein product [Notodromas monacha]